MVSESFSKWDKHGHLHYPPSLKMIMNIGPGDRMLQQADQSTDRQTQRDEHFFKVVQGVRIRPNIWTFLDSETFFFFSYFDFFLFPVVNSPDIIFGYPWIGCYIPPILYLVCSGVNLKDVSYVGSTLTSTVFWSSK